MKRLTTAAVMAMLVTALAGCGEGAAAPKPESSKISAAADQTKVIPDVTGKSFPVANNLLNESGLSAVAYGKDGKEWKTHYPSDADVVSSDPVAGTRTEAKIIRLNVDMNEADHEKAAKAAAAQAEADAEKARLAVRYEFSCGSSYEQPEKLHTPEHVWASPYYEGSEPCSVTIDGLGWLDEAKPVLLANEKAIVSIVKANGGEASDPVSTFTDVLTMCAKVPSDYADTIYAVPAWKKSKAQAALKLCPKAPHAKLFKEAITAVKIDDGNHIVGKNMEPGTYQTKPSSKDCYWSRNTGGGDIIDNDFVGYAPDGVTVTVYPGEGFESNRCGVWTKIG